MPKKKHNPNPNGRAGRPLSMAPMTGDEALRAVLQIAPADVKRILASKPGKKGKK
jgi:hypothetical protein